MEADVVEVNHAGTDGTLVIELNALQRAEDLEAFADVFHEFRHGGGVGQGGIIGDEGPKTLINLARLDALKEGIQLFLHGGGRRLGAGIAGQELGNQGVDPGEVIRVFLLFLGAAVEAVRLLAA